MNTREDPNQNQYIIYNLKKLEINPLKPWYGYST